MTTVASTESKLEAGDWVIDHPRILADMCYEVRAVEGEYVKLRAFHIPSKQRFNCTGILGFLALIRKKDGTRVNPPLVFGEVKA